MMEEITTGKKSLKPVERSKNQKKKKKLFVEKNSQRDRQQTNGLEKQQKMSFEEGDITIVQSYRGTE